MAEIIGANDPYKDIQDSLGNTDTYFEHLACVRLLDQMGEWLLSQPVGSSISLCELTIHTDYVKYDEDDFEEYVSVRCIEKGERDTFAEMDPAIFDKILPGIRFNHGFKQTAREVYDGAVRFLHGAKAYCEERQDYELKLGMYFRVRAKDSKVRILPTQKFVSLVRGTMA